MVEKEKLKIELRPSVKLALKPWLVIKLAQCLALREEDVVELLTEIEKSEEFQKLVSLKVISRKPFTTYYPTMKENYEYIDEKFLAPYDVSDIYKVINQNSEIVHLIQKIGEENYKKYFLSYEIYSFEEISKQIGISVDEVKKIFEFTNKILIYSELEYSVERNLNDHIPEKKYVRVAKINFIKQQPVITYYLTSMLRGEYNINYERLNEIIKKIPKQEKAKIRKIVKDLEILNIRKSTLHKIIETIAILQKEFLITGVPERRKVLTQKELAGIIGINPSIVCRIIRDKTIVGPSNTEYKLTYLTPNKKEVLMCILKKVIEEQRKKTLTDNQLCKTIIEKTGITVSRRTINYYKNSLQNTKNNN
ncbi:MAG: hypothetical protein NZ839_00585 [Endomicrobia bacterium]|nr:hypothetical protein [Endomicrobiia bacterium]